jgi:hypothetical protein
MTSRNQVAHPTSVALGNPSDNRLLDAFVDPAAANSLLTFLAQRFVATYQLLDCGSLVNEKDPVSVTMNKDGVAVATVVDTAALNRIVQRFAPQKADDASADSVSRERQVSE